MLVTMHFLNIFELLVQKYKTNNAYLVARQLQPLGMTKIANDK